MRTKSPSRAARFMPAGIPRYVRCYRDDSCPLDPYTVVFTGRAAPDRCGYDVQWPLVGLSGHGFTSNQPADTLPKDGKGYIWPPAMGRKGRLGVRIPFAELPLGLQRTVLADYREIWRIPA